MRENVIETRSLTKKYGDITALKEADITVKRGDIYGLVGDNGAGKTTFLKLLTGQIYPTGGELKLFGTYARKDMEQNRKRTGAIVENPGVFTQFYDLSRISGGDYGLELQEVDIARLLRESVIDAYQELRMKELDVELDIPDRPVYVFADANALERVFQNLLQNAGRYALSVLVVCLSEEKGGITITMENDTVCVQEDEL